MYAKILIQPPSEPMCVVVDTIMHGRRQVIETGRSSAGRIEVSIHFLEIENTGEIIHELRDWLESKNIVVM